MAQAYPLQALLDVRHFREEAARNEARAAERSHREALELVRQQQAELERYRQWRPEEESRRYAAIMGKSMSMEAMSAFRTGLTALAEGEAERERALAEADKQAELKEQALLAARQTVGAARKEAAKIEAHQEIWWAEEKNAAQRQEDLELEEFKAPAAQSDES